MNENIQLNPFFAALLDHIPDIERSCVEKQWIICVPQMVALPEPHRMSLRLLKMHVLVPIAEKSSEFETLLPGIRVTRINERDLQVIEGASQRDVTILYRETMYCGARGDESYLAWCVSRPFDGAVQIPMFDDGTEVFAEERPTDEWETILFSDAPQFGPISLAHDGRIQLEQLEHRIAALDDPFVVIPAKKEPKAYYEIRTFAERLSRDTVSNNECFEAAAKNQKFFVILQTAYESCALSATHAVLFASLAGAHKSAEDDLQTRLHDLRQSILENGGKAERVGLTGSFLDRFDELKRDSSAFKTAVSELQELNERKSPLEKLWCLRNASRALRGVPGNVNIDDALPLFLLVLLSAAPGLLLANLQFMSDLAPRLWVKSTGELSFHLTVFSGAVSLIQEHVFVQDEEQSLMRNLIVAGGSGLGVNWIGGAAGSRAIKPTTHVTLSDGPKNPGMFKMFESCTPRSRN